MFIGHFGVGLAAKSIAPKVSLGVLFIAAQFIDLLWPTFLLLGIERVRIMPGATTVTPLLFEYYPYSHSLLAVALWAVLLGGAYFWLHRDRVGAWVVGLLVVSHWWLDAIVHQPDLPLFPGSATMTGLNAWSSLPLTIAIEVPLFALGVWLYLRTTLALDTSGRWGFWALMVSFALIHVGNLFGAPPPSAVVIAWVGQLQWLFVLWAFWVDKHRHVRDKLLKE